ncbi:MAG: YciI-like protein [Balneolaceae bacterium]|nr:YciI-like protein [Balneolaceae bacterium]
MNHYLLIYELSNDYLERRKKYRKEHLELAWKASDDGILLAGGALQDPSDRAVLFFQTESPDVIEEFVKKDPYVQHGLVKNWTIRPWITVAGNLAVTPVKP